MFEHLLQADSTRTEQHEAFQSVPQLAVYDRSPNSIRPLESLWRRKSDSNALPRTKEIQGTYALVKFMFETQLGLLLSAALI